jgi:molecular chaperone DnaK
LADVSAGNAILVRFDLDLDGILKVTACERATGLEKALTIDSVISRFRREDRGEAALRIDEAFGGAGSAARPNLAGSAANVPAEVMPAELSRAIANAKELLEKSDKLAADANPDDVTEVKELSDQLRAAIAARSETEIARASAKLDDLVFYLQDV